MPINSAPKRDVTQLPVILSPESVAAPGIEYVKMQEHWTLGVDLWGGTKAMRKRNKRWLPQESGESDEAYHARLNKTFLYNGYKSTIQRLAGQTFFQPVVVENLPEELKYIEHDFNSEGQTITEVAHDLLVDMLRFGKCHGVVDYPTVSHNLTLAEERQLNIRPYFTKIDPRDLIAWRATRQGGADIVEQIRIQEFTIEPYDEYNEVETYRVRVFFPDRVDVWVLRYNKDEETYELEESYPYTLGEIPIVTAYGEKTGFMTAYPPLNDLAWLNLRHWQSTSDQNTILHVSRVPVFFAKGFEEGELANTTIGAYRGISTTSEQADIKYIEHSGTAIGAGRQDLRDLEQQMHEIGADLLTSRSVSRQTASARSIDRAESLSMLQTMLISLERMLEDSIEIAGKWIGVDASDVRVRISDETQLPTEPNPVDDLIKLYDGGHISKEKFNHELKRRGVLSDIVDNEGEFAEPQENTSEFEQTEEESQEE